jgi:hypothetical protein
MEVVVSMLVVLGHEPDRVETERFGPTGGLLAAGQRAFEPPLGWRIAEMATRRR